MKKYIYAFFLFFFLSQGLYAKPFGPAAGEKGSKAVSKDNIKITGWAVDYKNYIPGDDLADTWKDPLKALGKAEGTSTDIVSLGRGGEITLVFDPPIKNKEGLDFAVFENSFSNYFLELGLVYVSSDGENFAGFKTYSHTMSPVGAFGNINPENIHNFAGKYIKGYGTGFDLGELKDNPMVVSGDLDLDNVSFIKIEDIPGDGKIKDSEGRPVYDPYPTAQSAGFDLDGACALDGLTFSQINEDEDEDEVQVGNKKDISAGFGDETGCFIRSLF